MSSLLLYHRNSHSTWNRVVPQKISANEQVTKWMDGWTDGIVRCADGDLCHYKVAYKSGGWPLLVTPRNLTKT